LGQGERGQGGRESELELSRHVKTIGDPGKKRIERGQASSCREGPGPQLVDKRRRRVGRKGKERSKCKCGSELAS